MRGTLLRLLALLAVVVAHWLPGDAVGQVPDGLGHVALFAVAAVAAWGLLPLEPGPRAAAIVAGGALLAILLEASQPAFGRRDEPWDLVADLEGLLLATGALAAGRRA
jgi:VanZ family protein